MSVSPVKRNNTWLFTTHRVDPKTGEKIHKTKRGFKSRQKAEDAEYEFRREYFKVKVEGCQITFKDMFMKYMLSRKQEIKPTTYKNWMNRVEVHVIPKFSDMRMCEITLPNTTMKLLFDMHELHKQIDSFNERNWFVCGGSKPITSTTIQPKGFTVAAY